MTPFQWCLITKSALVVKEAMLSSSRDAYNIGIIDRRSCDSRERTGKCLILQFELQVPKCARAERIETERLYGWLRLEREKRWKDSSSIVRS